MTNRIESVVGETTTSGAVTSTIVELEIPDGFFGMIAIDVTAEEDGSPVNAYSFQNLYLVSGESGACTIRDASATPLELDPGAIGVSTVVNTNGQNFRVQGTGVAVISVNWAVQVSGLIHERA